MNANIDAFAEWVEDNWCSTKRPNEDRDLTIASLGFAGETGESIEHIKKYFRDGVFDRQKFIKEMGDAIHYWTKILNIFEIKPSEVLHENRVKIADRKARGVMSGSGSDR